MGSLALELRHALRRLAKTPLFTATAFSVLGLGIGANATVFAWARAILLDPIPGARDTGRLVNVRITDRNEGFVSFSYPDYRDLRDRATRLSGMVATRSLAAGLGSELGDRLHCELAVAIGEHAECGLAILVLELAEDLGEVGGVLLLQQVQQVSGRTNAQQSLDRVEDEIDSTLRCHRDPNLSR